MNGDAQGRTALILYGTETGTAQDLAEEVGRATERLHFDTTVAELDHVPITLPSTYTITIFVLSTTGQGEFPSNARVFWTNLLKKKLPATFLQGVSFFLVGLGDTSYPKFNWAARKLGKRLKQLGALEVIDACEADEQGEESTDGAFLAWLPLFKAAIVEDFPMPDGLQPIPDEQPLPSKWVLGPAHVVPNGHTDRSFSVTGDGDAVDECTRVNGQTTIVHPTHDTRPIPGSFPVCLQENKRVTPSSHWQDVRLLTLTTNRCINYLPGDALSIMPKNFPEDVNMLIHLMDWTSIADTPITFIPTSNPTDFANYPPCPIPYLFSTSSSTTTTLTLRTLLTSYLDITCIPRRSLFATLSRFSINNSTQRDRLLEFTLPQYLDEYYDYATRPRRSVLEILQEFDSVKVPWWEAANVFPLMKGRQFSIASGGNSRRLSEEEGGGTKFELLVAIVKYKTVIKKIRQGVCTRYLAAQAPGSTLNVVHRTDGRFSTKAKTPKQTRQGRNTAEQEEEDLMRPKLLIGAGTGIAPLRAIIQHDEELLSLSLQKPRNPTQGPDTTLFFGARNHDRDFFFADEWSAKTKLAPKSSSHHHPSSNPAEVGAAQFRLITSFSRDQPQKIYLQDRIREHAPHVFDLLVRKKATVVVCGSSGAMPKAVRRALVDVLVRGGNTMGINDGDSRGGERVEEEVEPSERSGVEAERDYGEEKEEGRWWCTQEQAERYLDAMEKDRRYLQETW
ncbi:hypothetical protein EPUS_06777 [Endocarpon pusillum Z07020]|uniref:NADPH-dependent diflavin oxidoreductase 1 n=1 Tax=Endocarpon pusillum (strain Z07020 / HMAS-L-300199) TaxID=1263415 RepID=U1G9I6_ENDPU|nr:uncharacterized protein EPUS_06777 [Endocarpon pusillum Z07020]ERF68361.1 hypothetical protein EPUS_06777 [Endocarpon pusillum Z07020]